MSVPLAEVRLIRSDGRTTVQLAGEIDLSNAAELEREISELAEPGREVVVDLCAVAYMDSQGIRLLYALSLALEAKESRLVVVAPPDSVAGEILQLTRMNELLVVRESPE